MTSPLAVVVCYPSNPTAFVASLDFYKDLVPFAPTKWQDLWDPRLKGKMAGPAATFDPGYFPLMAAVINGVSIFLFVAYGVVEVWPLEEQ